jgi:RNA polymerase sigma factor (sigma-70 family)
MPMTILSLAVAVESLYAVHREYVLSVLGSRCRWLGTDEREALFHDAYVVMLEKERDGELETATMHPSQVRAYLTQTAIFKALDEGKRVERKRTEPLGEEIVAQPDPGAEPAEVAAANLDTARVREIVAELPARGQAIVKLRFFLDRTPEEIQRMLAISPRAYRRELERAMRYVSQQYELVRSGEFCQTRRSLILAYVAGIAGPNRAREARQHLASCPGCTRWGIELREAARRIAVLLPPVTMAPKAEPFSRIAEAVAALRDKVTQLALAGRQHAAALEARSDAGLAGYVGSARPGGVAAVVASCLAIGGGAGYCAVHGISNPLDGLLGHDPPHAAHRHRPRPAPARAVPPPRPSPAPPKPVAPPPKPEPKPKPEPPPPELETPSEPEAAASEFGLEGSASGASPESSEAAAAAPAPAPQPPGEFDP